MFHALDFILTLILILSHLLAFIKICLVYHFLPYHLLLFFSIFPSLKIFLSDFIQAIYEDILLLKE